MSAALQQAIEDHRERVTKATALHRSAMHTKMRADRMFDLYRHNCSSPKALRYMQLMLRATSLFSRRLSQHTEMIIDLSHRIATMEAR